MEGRRRRVARRVDLAEELAIPFAALAPERTREALRRAVEPDRQAARDAAVPPLPVALLEEQRARRRQREAQLDVVVRVRLAVARVVPGRGLDERRHGALLLQTETMLRVIITAGAGGASARAIGPDPLDGTTTRRRCPTHRAGDLAHRIKYCTQFHGLQPKISGSDAAQGSPTQHHGRRFDPSFFSSVAEHYPRKVMVDGSIPSRSSSSRFFLIFFARG